MNKVQPQVALAILWIFLSANYIFCDVLSNMDPTLLKGIIESNTIGNIDVTETFLLSGAIILEIPFIMILVSLFAPFRTNRIMNMIAGVVMILIQIGSFSFGTSATLHYIFFSSVEIITCIIIARYACLWKPEIN